MARRMRRRSVLRLGGGMFTGATLAGLAGCGGTDTAGAEDGQLRVSWWGEDERHTRTSDALDLFAEQTEGVEISTEYTGDFDGYFDRLSTQMAGGRAPDLLQMSGQFITEYASRGALLALDAHVPDPIDLSDWDEGSREDGRIEGALVGLPAGIDGYCVLYDQTKLDELGVEFPGDEWTWEEFAEFLNEISEAGDGYVGCEDSGWQYEVLQVFLRQRGKELFGDGELGFNEEDIVDLWGFWHELRESGAIVDPDVQAAATTVETSPLIQGQAAVAMTSSSQLTNFAGLTENELQITMFPFGSDGTPGQVIRTPMYFCIYADSPQADDAAGLLNFLLNDDDAAEILQTTRAVPVSTSVRDTIRPTVDEAEQRSFDYLDLVSEYAEPMQLFPPGFGDYRELYERLYNQVAFGEISLEEGAQQLVDQAPEVIG